MLPSESLQDNIVEKLGEICQNSLTISAFNGTDFLCARMSYPLGSWFTIR